MKKLNLRLFDGEGAGGAAGAAGAPEGTAEASAAAAGNQQVQTETPEMTLEERKAAYAQFKDQYKDFYAEDVKKAINRKHAENQKLAKQVDEYAPLMEMLALKYGAAANDVNTIMAAIDKDTTFFEEEALKHGMPVETYKEFMQLQSRNKAMEESMRRAENIRQREQTYARWDAEAAQCKALYPEFDIETEIETNPQFTRLLGAGVDVTTAYQAAHFNDISKNLIARTETETKKKVSDNIRAGAGKPKEAAAGAPQAGKAMYDIEKMSSAEFRKFKEDVMSGRVTLS